MADRRNRKAGRRKKNACGSAVKTALPQAHLVNRFAFASADMLTGAEIASVQT
jgi:hypothetical protein